MRKLALLLVSLVALLAAGSGCLSGDIEARLGQQFSLSPGQEARLDGENMRISFKEVIEDSRCPRDVVCVWEGRVVSLLQIIRDGSATEVTLTQPGLTDQPAVESHQGYIFTFHIEPYPEQAGKPIASSEYRLLLTLSK